MISRSRRVDRLPEYAVAELAVTKKQLQADGVDVIDLSAGDTDMPPPEIAVETLREAVGDPAMSRYAYQVGLPEFREAASRYMKRRFGVDLDPYTEILPLIGSKEGLVNLPLAVLNPGDICVMPDPGYPAYVGAAVLSETEVEYARLTPEARFLVELEDLPAGRVKRTGLVYLNYPNNPTAAVAPRDYLERTVNYCREHDIVIAFDNPYVEITYDGYRAPSIMEVDGARDVALEFHSLSKSFSMTGWRIGFAAGGVALIESLRRVKSYVDTGPFLAVQRAAAAVLDRAEELVQPVVQRLKERRDIAVAAFTEAGLPTPSPQASMYMWIPLDEGVRAKDFARRVLEEEGVVLLPGNALGAGGEGFVRVALTVPGDRIREGAERVGRVLARREAAGAR